MRWSNAFHAVLILLLSVPALAGRPKVVHPKVVAIHEVLATKAGAVVWLKRDERGAFAVEEILPLRQPLRMWLYPEPMGEGTWIQLMTRSQRPMGTFRAAIPEPGTSCGVEVPLVRGAWWLLIYDEHHGMRRLLAHLEVGPKLAYVARRNRLPVLGATKPPRPARSPVATPPAGRAR